MTTSTTTGGIGLAEPVAVNEHGSAMSHAVVGQGGRLPLILSMQHGSDNAFSWERGD
jgi:hypothetical protein